MLIESDDLIAVFDLQIAVCCHERNPATMYFDCQQHQKTIDTIKLYVKFEGKRQAVARRVGTIERRIGTIERRKDAIERRAH